MRCAIYRHWPQKKALFDKHLLKSIPFSKTPTCVLSPITLPDGTQHSLSLVALVVYAHPFQPISGDLREPGLLGIWSVVSRRLQSPRAPSVTSEPSLRLSVVFQSSPALRPPLTALPLLSGLWLVTSESRVRVPGRATAGAQVCRREKVITLGARSSAQLLLLRHTGDWKLL